MQGKYYVIEGDFLAAQRRSEELERERLLLLDVVNVMQGHFGRFPRPSLNRSLRAPRGG
jgi:hypothetical protein